MSSSNGSSPVSPDTLNELLHRLGHEMHDDSTRWFGQEVADNLVIQAIGVVSEGGEMLDEIKKVLRGSQSLEEARDKIALELIDVFIYWCMMIAALEIDVEAIYHEKRQFNEERFGTHSE